MSTFTVAITYTHTVTYVTTKILLTLKEIIREIGLDPVRFTDSWHAYEGAISTWLSSRHLQCVSLEVYDPRTQRLCHSLGHRRRVRHCWRRCPAGGYRRRTIFDCQSRTCGLFLPIRHHPDDDARPP